MSGVFRENLGPGIPKTKEFNGKKYKLEEVFTGESAAKRMAERIRAQGDKARVVKFPKFDSYAVYYNNG